uniref:Uncharacterized protein LOC114348709 n=1 Tax=Diabrotica virgifera virgifera TaxID=50390 RepID=A0A6P7GZ49_DIAVI
MGGYNNNATAKQFKAAYKKMLKHLELRDSFRGNCIPLEVITVMAPEKIMNTSCGRERIVEDECVDDNDDIYNTNFITSIKELIIYTLQERSYYIHFRICHL